MENIESALKEAEKVCKRQKASSAKILDNLSKLHSELVSAADSLNDFQDPTAVAGVLHALQSRIEKSLVTKTLASETKELHGSINKLGKAVDKAFVDDNCKAARDIEFDKHALNTVVAEHLFRVGNFGVGETFIKEADLVGSEELKETFRDLHTILQQILEHNLAPALQWVGEHRQELEHNSKGRGASTFEFQLHQLQFLHTLSSQGALAAVGYARGHFGAFQTSQMSGIQRLMGCLCYTKRPLPPTYLALMAPDQWQAAAREFARQYCRLLGKSYESPLLVTVAAGSVALPTLLKLASVMEGQAQDLSTCEQLPVDLELGSEFVFHNIFACPVSRDQSGPNNPPMMLQCGHVLCAASIDRIVKSPARSFKCPYCPAETSKVNCRVIRFPDDL